MPVRGPTISDGLNRSGAYLSFTSDWTISGWFNAPPPGLALSTIWLFGAFGGAGTPQIYMYFDPNGFNFGAEGTGASVDIPSVTINPGWLYPTVTYNATTHDFKVYLEASLVGTINLNLSSFTFTTTENLLKDTNVNNQNGASAAYFRVWQRILTPDQMAVERQSYVAVLRTNLLADTPLYSPSDVTDISGNGRNWSTTGTMASFNGPSLYLPTIRPSIWMEFRLEEYPSGAITTYKWSTRPMADSGSFKEGRIVSWGDVDRAMSSITGDYEVAKTTVVLDDADGLIRGLLTGASTKYFMNREAAIKLLSEAGRAAGVPPRLLFRGRINDYQLQTGRKVMLGINDLVGSQFSGFDLEKLIPQAVIGDEHTNINALPNTKDNLGKVYPIYAGEHSDNGAVDIAGNNAEKGLCPVLDVGDYDITGSTAPPPMAAPPVITDSGVVGTSGQKTYYYAVSLITPYGESTLSNVVTINGASSRNVSNFNWIQGTYDNGGASPFNKVRIWRSEVATSFTQWLDEANYTLPGPGTWAYADGAAPMIFPSPVFGVTRDELDDLKDGSDISTSTALNSDTVWGRLVVAIGVYNVLSVYASDMAAGATPKRVKLDSSLEGSEYILPSSPQWPYPNPYLELTNSAGETIRMTVILMRGPRLNAHRDGSVTVAVNLCGPENVGDGSGTDIDQAFYQLQWFLNTHVLYNDGKGYRSGNWPGLVTYANGDAILQTSKYTAAQNQTITWVGGRGYKGHIALTEQITVREFVRRWNVTMNSFMASNHFGQIYPVLIDDSATTAGPIYRDNMEIGGLDDMTYLHEVVQTFVDYIFDWDPDAGAFRQKKQTITDATATSAWKAKRPGALREAYYTRDPTTANDSQSRFLLLVKGVPRFATFHTDLSGTQTELGDPYRLTHYDGSPDNATQMLAFRHKVNPSSSPTSPPTIWITGLDVARIRGLALPLLQDETTMTGNLGDETSSSPPPVGAFELR